MKRWGRSRLMLIGVFGVVFLAVFILPALAMEESSGSQTGIVTEESVIASGNVTDTVTWKITEDDVGEQTLIIGGTGPMTDYTGQDQQPWAEWRKTIDTLIVEDGVTRIGNNSMSGMYFKNVRIGSGVEAIGTHAFAYGYNLEHITIPGNVKKVEANAFVFHRALYSVTLEEGVEELAHSAFGTQASKSSVFHIPASVTNIADLACWPVSGYTVAEDNQHYSAIDGILYTKDGTALVDYPKQRAVAEYRIPDEVCEIKKGAFQRVAATKKIYIPSSVQILPETYLMQWSAIEEVYIEDGVPVTGHTTFYSCNRLTSIRLPEDMPIKQIFNMLHYNCNSLESLKIPNGVEKIERIGWPLKALQKITYDAKNAVIKDNQLLDPDITYELTIGENVDHLPAEFGWLTDQADIILFQGPNQFTVEADAFSGKGSPVENLEGSIYVDEQGIIYQYDKNEGTAKVVYCQDNYEDIFVPGEIQPEENVICKVTSIGKDAFQKTEKLRSITLERPEQILSIDAYGFANCETLSAINGLTSVEEVTNLFVMAEGNIGYRAFYNTGLLAATDSGEAEEYMTSCKEISVSGGEVSNLTVSVKSEGNTLEWEMGDGEEQGAYSLMTGDTMTILAAAGNTEAGEEFRYRIYFRWTGDDCSLSVKKGESYLFEEQTVTCNGTEDPNSLYLEFTPAIGKTLSVPVTAVYPSPSSAGGGLTIWAMVLSEEEAEVSEGKLIFSDIGSMQAEWITARDSFSLTKTGTGSSSITLKGTPDGTVIPGADLSWKFVMQRQNESTSAYGKDYVRSVAYQDTITLPKGIQWKEEIVQAIQEGQIRRSGNYWYVGEQKVFYLVLSGGQMNLSAVYFKWDEELKTAVLSFVVTNSSRSAEMNTNTISYTVYADALEADVSVFSETEDNIITNTVEAVVKYQHSNRMSLESTAAKSLKMGTGSLKLTNTAVTKPYYFGEPVEYEIVLSNPGALPYSADEAGIWRIQDVLSPYTYIEPADMEKMFAEDADKSLTVTITGVEQMEWEEQQGIYEGTVFWKNGFNTGENLMDLSAGTITIGWNSSRTGIQAVFDGKVYEEATIEKTLKVLGYSPGRWAEYTLTWCLNGEEDIFQLRAGETRSFSIYATAKNTFQMLSEDWQTSYPTDAALTLTNTAGVMNQSGQMKTRASVGNAVKREAYVEKRAFVNGTELADGFEIEDGTCMTYSLEFTHYGKGSYDNLPIVDDMYGAQALLVPVDKNTHLNAMGLAVYEKAETEYYILTEGSYNNVKIGGIDGGKDYIAAVITVEKVNEERTVLSGEESHSFTGLHTRIEWKCPHLQRGSYKMYILYETIVEQKLSNGNVYSVGNTMWMNGKKNSRIYASLWGGGTIIDFYKEILEKKGMTWKDDVVVEGGYSLLSAGDQVTYRLMLRSKGTGEYTVKGPDIADQLPFNGDIYKWTKDANVVMTYESTHASTEVVNLDSWTIADSWNEQTEEGVQYILWSEQTEITFTEANAKVYIYVTLTYPDNIGDNAVWHDYCSSVNGDILVNTFYVYQFPVNVTHHLRESGQVLLQKGIYGTSYGTEGDYTETQSRLYYNNKDSQDRQVTYYVVLYNGGTKRWYLDDIYDSLPDGFTYTRMIHDTNLNQKDLEISVVTKSEFDGNNLIDVSHNLMMPEEVVYRSALIRRIDAEAGYLRFRIDEGEGEKAVCYDEEREQYYLNQNEAIVFGYMCDVGLTEETTDVALNTMFMRYTDYPRTGLNQNEELPIAFSGALNESHGDQNDGNYSTMSGTDVKQQYGIIDGSVDDTWLVSDVSVSRGQIIPGLTKYTESYVASGSSLVTEYVNAVGPFDQINWRVRLHNSGTLSITDYEFKDILPAPYVFSGTVSYTIYDYLGNEIQSYDLLSFSERTENQVTIKNNNSTAAVPLDGENVAITLSNNGTGSLSLAKQEDGSEVLTICFSDYRVSIPEGGCMDIRLSAYNPTNHFKNTVYTNQAVLTPKIQEFYAVGQGSMIKNQDGNPESVNNSAPVTVSFGYATSSRKAVIEKNDTANLADSTNPEDNYILLSSEDGVFTYELTVTNDTEKGMERLILIDSLPEIGDHSPFNVNASRNSEFNVILAEEPNFKVVVTQENGNVRELTNQEYSVDYSAESSFSEADWNGSSIWNGTKEQVGTLRFIIHDDTGEKIPAKAKVTVSFDCVAWGNPEAGQTAWNSFGYHYKLQGMEQELEAMPLVVGVKIPEMPVLEKRIEDVNGNPFIAPEDTQFAFVIYEGTAMEDVYTNQEELLALLEEKSISYMVQDVEVKKGENRSESVALKDMEWQEGASYIITEVPTDPAFEFLSFNGLNRGNYSFTYGRNERTLITCVNTYVEWSLEVTKADADNPEQYLEGAVFALYSPDKEMNADVPEEWNAWNTIEYKNQTWYLAGIQNTDTAGKITWDHLQKESYYLLELKAPDGYNRQEEGQMIYRRNAQSGIVQAYVTNEKGANLPKTGGTGTGIYTLAGCILAALACFMFQQRKRKDTKE